MAVPSIPIKACSRPVTISSSTRAGRGHAPVSAGRRSATAWRTTRCSLCGSDATGRQPAACPARWCPRSRRTRAIQRSCLRRGGRHCWPSPVDNRALTELEQAVDLEGRDPVLRLCHEAVLRDAHRLDEAASELRKAIRTRLLLRGPRYWLASVYAAQGKVTEAIEQYRLFLGHAAKADADRAHAARAGRPRSVTPGLLALRFKQVDMSLPPDWLALPGLIGHIS